MSSTSYTNYRQYPITPINLLNSINSPNSADKYVLFSTLLGTPATITQANLLTYLQENITTSPSTARASPTTGQSVDLSAYTVDTWLILTPLATIADLTIILPTAPEDTQELVVNTTQQITTLTITVSGAITVVGAPTTLNAPDFFRLRYDTNNGVWYRVG